MTYPRVERCLIARTATLIAVVTLTFAATTPPAAQAGRYPAQVPKHWHAPAWWLPAAICIHEHEGAWNAATGNGYEGGMQFLRSTWVSVGGPVRGYHWASVASVREQLYRSWLLYVRSGYSWQQWGTRGVCGLR